MPQLGKQKMATLPDIQVGSGGTREESTDADLGKGRGTDLIIHRRPRRKRSGNSTLEKLPDYYKWKTPEQSIFSLMLPCNKNCSFSTNLWKNLLPT